MGRYNLYSAEEIAQLDLETFSHWLTLLYKNPGKFNDSNWLHECWCPQTQAHSRVNPLNIRSKYEGRILNAVKNNNKNKMIRLLSLGSGGLFQDLMVLLTLYYKGYEHIELDCIEIEDNQVQQSILQAIIERLNQNGAKIIVRHFKKIEETDLSPSSYDVAYAIDFDDISLRQLIHRCKENDFICPLFLEAYAALKSSSLFLLTFGTNYIAHHGEKVELHFEGDHQFEKKIAPAHHDYYYIHANILSLLMYLPFLKAKKKPLLINAAILNEETTLTLKKLLTQQDIDYVIAKESVIGKKVNEECASVLIIDDIINDKTQSDQLYYHPVFQLDHARVSRVNLATERVTVSLPLNVEKQKQLLQTINDLPIETYLTSITAGIQNYLDWCSKNASGIRGLTRFSHWYHGDSGIRRAHTLQKMIQTFSNTSEDPDVIKAELNKKLEGSSNTRHSLVRFICSALTKDMEIETLTDCEYRAIRNTFTPTSRAP